MSAAVIWSAIVAAVVAAWLAIFAIDGWALVGATAAAGIALLTSGYWWLHTWSEREARRSRSS